MAIECFPSEAKFQFLYYEALETAAALRAELAEAKKDRDAKQAKIDELMLEYCPEEITPEQLAEYERNQVPAIDALGIGKATP